MSASVRSVNATQIAMIDSGRGNWENANRIAVKRKRSEPILREAQTPRVPGKSETRSLDQIDRRIVAALQSDGRRAFSSIAEQLEISESVVRYRVQRLEKSEILQVVGIADPLKLGFDLMAMVGVKTQPGELGHVARALTELPETSYIASTAGRFDALVELVCRDTAHFQKMLTKIRMTPGVAETESFLILEIHKMAYGWGAGDQDVPLAATEDRPKAARKKTAPKKPRLTKGKK